MFPDTRIRVVAATQYQESSGFPAILVLRPDRIETAAELSGLRFAWPSKHARKFSVISSLG
jgi:hypothetical protein